MSRGQALAEFALASTAMFAMIFGIIDCGRALYAYHLVSNAARLATRYAIVNASTACPSATPPSPDPLYAYVKNQSPGIDPAKLAVSTACSTQLGCSSTAAPYNGSSCAVTVTVSYQFNFIAPLVSLISPTMSSTSEMSISQ